MVQMLKTPTVDSLHWVTQACCRQADHQITWSPDIIFLWTGGGWQWLVNGSWIWKAHYVDVTVAHLQIFNFATKNAHSCQPHSLPQLLGYEFVELYNCLKLLSRARLINFERYYLIMILIFDQVHCSSFTGCARSVGNEELVFQPKIKPTAYCGQ